jgi:hypothetical protein
MNLPEPFNGAPPDQAASREARQLYAQSLQGILSTLSLNVAGYPFGSVATFAPDREGRPVMLISAIAEHTKNIRADSRVSLTLIEGGDDIQAAGRLTLIGDAAPVVYEQTNDVAARYFRRFPHATAYRRAHDFSFYRIEPVRVRYIGGFGRIHWLEPEALCPVNPFDEETEAFMTEHMNSGHAGAMRDYCALFGVNPGSETPRLAGIDGEGFDLVIGKRLLRVGFDQPVAAVEEVRAAMVALARRARGRKDALA